MAKGSIPLARRSQATDTFASAERGVIDLPNPYDWLEDTSSPETAAFVEAQNAAFAAYVDDSGDKSLGKVKQQLATGLLAMTGLTAIASVPQVIEEDLVFRVQGRGKEFAVSYRIPKSSVVGGGEQAWKSNGDVHGHNADEPAIFYDEGEQKAVLTASSPSRSGKYWAFTTSDAGADWGVIRVMDVQTGKVLSDEIRGTRFTSKPSSVVPWLGDRGFFYPHQPGGGQGGKSSGQGGNGASQLRFHEIGRPQEEDEVVYADAEHPGYNFKAVVSQDDRSVFLEVYDRGRGCQVWSAAVNAQEPGQDAAQTGHQGGGKLGLRFDGVVSRQSDAEWEYIGTFSETTASDATTAGDSGHLFWTNADNGKVMAYRPQTGAVEEVVAPHSQQTLRLARMLSAGHILVVRSIDVRDQVQIFSPTGRHLKTLEGVPVWTILDASYDPSTETIFLVESSFCYPPRVWYARAAGDNGKGDGPDISPFKPIELFPPNQNSLTGADPPPQLSTKQIFYTSRDGTRVPMFLTSADPEAIQPGDPVLLYLYGGFGISVIPHFRADFVAFLRTFGGVLAIANVRGGGEYGQTWYEAACRERRQNLFDDVHAAAAHLRARYASRTIILMGESMGGLNCAAAMVQQPDLFDAAILNAGVVDVLHRQRLARSDRGAHDIGDVHDPVEFDLIHKWSPLDKVRPGVRYPPVLLTAGDKDDFVSYSHSCKMAAALQYAGRGGGGGGDDQPQDEGTPKGTTHLRIIRDLGHSGNISAKQKAAVGLERWLWVKKTLGLEIHAR
ncbi:Prolyl oligopeptidase, beta-propeller domain-containing protein [Cladophialophora immunda]|nr:Prolyl oligopeptidase, beta-propeller domain-containing protein [Cladophialophora immunda]